MDAEYQGPTRKELMYMIWDYNRNQPLRYQIAGVDIADSELLAIKNMHTEEKTEFCRRVNRHTHYLRELKRNIASNNDQQLWDNLVACTVTMNQEAKTKRKDYMQQMDARSAKELQAKQPRAASQQVAIRNTPSNSKLHNAAILAEQQRPSMGNEWSDIQAKIHGSPNLVIPAGIMKREPSPHRPPAETAPPKKKPTPQPVAKPAIQQPQIHPQPAVLIQNPKLIVPQLMPRPPPRPKEEKQEEKKPGRETIANQKMILALLEAQKLASEVRKF